MSGKVSSMVKRQRDFSAGQIDANAHRRDDRPEFKYGVRRGLNCTTTNSGSLRRRISRSFLYFGSGVRDEFRPFAGMEFQIEFSDGKFTARSSGVIVAELAAPWTESQLSKLRWDYALNNIIICGPAPMRTQVIVFDLQTMTWLIFDYTFDLSVNGAVRAPFFRFESNGVTMRPSALTGSITLTMSGAAFDPAHVGVVFRYVNKQVRIDSVTSPILANATVLEPLPPTYQINIASSNGFSVGEIVEADTSGFKGEIIAVPDATHINVVAMDNWYELSTTDTIVGPVASEKVIGKTSITPGATVQWDEEFMSDFRGWPQSVSTDVQRVIFCNFPQAKNFIQWSAVSAPFDCFIGAEPTAAMLEYIPRECTILHVIGGYDEFALTDAGAYYIPVSGGTPLQPGSVEFRQISSGAIADVKPIAVTEGVIYVDSTLNRISAITATGQTARPYQVAEISRFHSDLFNGIVALAASTTDPTVAGRQMYVINGDGTWVVGRYEPDRDFVGWFPHSTAGLVTHVQARYDSVLFTTDYSGVTVAEEIDPDAYLDCAIRVIDSGLDYLQLSDGSPLLLSTGNPLHLARMQMAEFAGVTMQIWADGFYLGDIDVAADGFVSLPGGYSEIVLGFKWDLEFEPNIEDFEGGEAFGQRLRRRKINQALFRVLDTQQFRVGHREFGSYRQGDNMDAPVPSRSDTYRYREIGRSWDPNLALVQDVPGNFELLELTMEVTI